MKADSSPIERNEVGQIVCTNVQTYSTKTGDEVEKIFSLEEILENMHTSIGLVSMEKMKQIIQARPCGKGLDSQNGQKNQRNDNEMQGMQRGSATNQEKEIHSRSQRNVIQRSNSNRSVGMVRQSEKQEDDHMSYP